MKRIILVLVVVIVALMSVGMVAAQGPNGQGNGQGRGGRGMMDGAVLDIITAATGLDGQAIIDQLSDGSTLADLITANGGDVAAVEAQLTAEITAKGNLDEAAVQERVADILNGDFLNGRGGEMGDGAVLDILTTATGLEASELRQQLRDGTTLSDLITANGGDVAAVEAQLTAEITAKGNLDEAAVQERVANILSGDFGGRGGDLGDGAVLDILTTATGLEASELRQQLRDGATLSDLITANGGDVVAVEAQLTTEITANHTQLDAAAVQERVDNVLNGQLPGRGGRGGFGPQGQGGGQPGQGLGQGQGNN